MTRSISGSFPTKRSCAAGRRTGGHAGPVFVSNVAGGLFLDKEEKLQRYAFVFDHLRAGALTPEEAVSVIAGMAKEQ